MSDDQIRQLMVTRLGLRIRSNMTDYVRRRLLDRQHQSIPVMGGDARTGVAVRRVVALAAFEETGAPEKDASAAPGV